MGIGIIASSLRTGHRTTRHTCAACAIQATVRAIPALCGTVHKLVHHNSEESESHLMRVLLRSLIKKASQA